MAYTAGCVGRAEDDAAGLNSKTGTKNNGKEAKNELKEESQKLFKGTGRYAKGWTVKKDRKNKSYYVVSRQYLSRTFNLTLKGEKSRNLLLLPGEGFI